MRRISVVGIGSGNPEHVTVQAVSTLNTVDVIFIVDKGESKRQLTDLRRDICERYITGRGYRIVTAADPRRDRGAAAYRAAVADWRGQRADSYEQLIRDELGEDEHGAFLAWGDPAIYDSTVHVLDEVLARGTVTFDLQVIPGISSVQVLAARHRVSLTRTGRPVHLMPGRLLAEGWFPENSDDVVVMLDAGCAFTELDLPGVDIYWGAYVGSDDEILISGPVTEVGPAIVAAREAARRQHGWIMDSYLLRRRIAGS
ncbi:MAG: precorrin-6A synthase (deacetylating) [Streptosporangiaceae bacterium]